MPFFLNYTDRVTNITLSNAYFVLEPGEFQNNRGIVLKLTVYPDKQTYLDNFRPFRIFEWVLTADNPFFDTYFSPTALQRGGFDVFTNAQILLLTLDAAANPTMELGAFPRLNYTTATPDV